MNPNTETLSRQRCFNHEFREAVARCLECRRYFCRECVTEHEDRILCSGCLDKIATSAGKRKKRFVSIGPLFSFLAGTFLVWVVFYYLGRILLSLPASFHEGTLWKNLW